MKVGGKKEKTKDAKWERGHPVMNTEVNERGSCADVDQRCIFMHIRLFDRLFVRFILAF